MLRDVEDVYVREIKDDLLKYLSKVVLKKEDSLSKKNILIKILRDWDSNFGSESVGASVWFIWEY
jgi:hypothetical protein